MKDTPPAACQIAEFDVIRAGDQARVRSRFEISSCRECRGLGMVPVQIEQQGRTYAVMQPCTRKKQQLRFQRFDDARIPAVHVLSTFENYRPNCTEQDQALQVARNFALTYPHARGYILSGPVGTGKTHLMTATLRALTLERGVRCHYVEMSLLFATIRRGFHEGRSGAEIIQPLSEMDVLAVDELGKGRGSAFEMETVDELVARRYNAGRLTLLATNYSLRPNAERKGSGGYLSSEDLKEGGKDARLLVDRVGDRIFSRLYEMCDFVEFPQSTGDGRQAKNAKRTNRRV